MQSNAARTNGAATPADHAMAARASVDYGGLVGNLLSEIETRLAVSPSPTRPDAVHVFSVASGYVGLAIGFVLTGAGLVWLVS